MGPFTPDAHGGFKYVSKITDQFARWTAGLLAGEHELRLQLLSPVCRINYHSLRWPSRSLACRQKGGNTRAKRSSRIAWKQASPRSLRPPTRLRKMACPRALAGPFAVWLAAFSSIVNSRPSCGGRSCSLRLNSAAVCHTPGLTWRRRSSGYMARRPIYRISRSSALELSSTSRMPRRWNPSPGRNAVRLQRERSALLPGLEPENSQGGGE